jgi:hypothetical protein
VAKASAGSPAAVEHSIRRVRVPSLSANLNGTPLFGFGSGLPGARSALRINVVLDDDNSN